MGSALQELKDYRGLILLLTILGVAVLAPYMLVPDQEGSHLNGFLLFLAAGLVLLALVHRKSFFLLCLLLVSANLIYLHLNHHWGNQQLNSRIETAFESPPSEALEYLQAHLDSVDAAVILYFSLYLVALIGCIVRSRILRPRALQWFAGAALIAWSIVGAAFRLDSKLPQFPPYKLGAETIHAKARYELLRGRRDFLARHPLTETTCSDKYDKVVIVLGESAASDHMSVFGYGKSTTPFAVESKPYAFEALAPSNQTRYSIPMMLSKASPGHFDVFYKQHSLVGQLRACGFRTLWISNQGRVGVYDSFTTSLAMEADEQIFLNKWSWTHTRFDGQIVDELAARKAYDRHRQVTFIHLIGSHTRYVDRYPKSFASAEGSGTVAQYDNSLRYTDHILSELYDNFSHDSLLFIYVSDHGQFVSEKKFGSGFLPGYREEFRVPLLIWTEDRAAIERIRSDLGGSRLNTDSLNDVILFLVGHAVSPDVSTARTISVVSPENVQVYDDLAAFGGK